MEYQGLIWFSQGMNRFPIFIFMMMVMIAGVLMSLWRQGVSLRVATLIKPSEWSHSTQISQALLKRLYPDLQSKKIMIVVSQESKATELVQKIGEELNQEVVQTSVGHLQKITSTSLCQAQHCLLLATTKEELSQVEKEYQQTLSEEDSKVFRLDVIQFVRDEPFIESCNKMKRLNDECIRSLSIRDAKRKMTDPQKKYFFLKKYNHNRFYLFFE